jgi:hypothetical protein
MLTLDPELKLAGKVAGIRADLKRRDDDGADRPRLLLGGCLDNCERREEKKAQDATRANSHAELL